MDNVTGGNKRRIQRRRAPRVSFTDAKRQIFLDHLASCCNVMRAAEAAGAGVSTVYDARRRDPAFAEQWAEAIESGYATLEALMIERAAAGGNYSAGDTPVPGPETIDTSLAMELLKLHRAPPGRRPAGGAPPRRAQEKELAAAIVAKLDLLEKRRAKASAESKERASTGPARTVAGGLGREEGRRFGFTPLTPALSPGGRGGGSGG
jgi:hypothetical protein